MVFRLITTIMISKLFWHPPSQFPVPTLFTDFKSLLKTTKNEIDRFGPFGSSIYFHIYFPKLCSSSTTHFNISITNSERTVPQSWNQICSCAAQSTTMNGKKCIKIRVNIVSRMDNFSLIYRNLFGSIHFFIHITMAMVRHKSYISVGNNFNNILKYIVLSSNFGGYLKLLKVI